MPIFLDIEASGLGSDSYPVEVGWGDTETNAVEAHLINPVEVPEWDAPMDPVARDMHGLTRDFLRSHGEAPTAVAARMNEALRGRTAYASSAFDFMWMGALFPDGGRAFELALTNVLWSQLLAGPEAGERVERAEAEAWKRLWWAGWRPHRVETDVRHLMEMHRILALGY